jgi:hypothetical protein
MLKLYHYIDGKLRYHEAWANGPTITEHWGVVGEKGDSAEHKRNKKLDEDADIECVLAEPRSSGYSEFDDEQLSILLVEYTVEGMGTEKDLTKRHALEDRLGETLGWTGLGHVDGGSIGSGTMEVCCVVVDFEIAKRTIESELVGTKFSDFTQIINE